MGAPPVTRLSMDWLKQAANAARSAYARWAPHLTLGNLVSISWVSIWVVVCVMIFQDLSRDLVTIEPISTPKAFAEQGYTPEVASRRLRDALNQYADNAHTTMQIGEVATREELPDFVLPKIDLSLNSIVASIRGVLHYGDSQHITGEFIARDKLLLRLRIDGQEIFSGSGDIGDPDELLARAAPTVIEKVRPFIFVATLFGSNPKQAVEKAQFLIDHRPSSDANVQWSYILKGFWLGEQHQFAEAEAVLRNAVKLNWRSAVAHAALGNALRDQEKFEEAILQYRRGIAIDPNFARVHYEFAIALEAQAKPAEAIAELRQAIRIDPKFVFSHVLLARLLFVQGKFDDAMVEHKIGIEYARTALELNYAHTSFADDLSFMPVGDIGNNREDAVVHYRLALRSDPNNAAAYNGMGQILATQLKFDEATSAFREGLLWDPDNATIRKSLTDTLQLEKDIANMREAGWPR